MHSGENGKTLASGSADDTIRLWDVAYVRATAAALRASAGGPLTRAEWRDWVGAGLEYQDICHLPPVPGFC
jgi:hypothetical protein